MVFGHNIQYGSGSKVLMEGLYFENTVFQLIYSFHMPCLMMISGYFFAFSIAKPDFWKRKVQNTLVPTLAWSAIPAVLPLAKSVVSHNLTLGSWLSAGKTFFTYYWFLWAILIFTFVIWIFHQFCNDNLWAYIFIFIALLFTPDWLNTSLWKYMYPYFVAGYLWNSRKVEIQRLKERKALITVMLFAIFGLLFMFYNTDSFIYTTGIAVRDLRQFGIDIYRYAIGFVGSALVIWIVYLVYPTVERSISSINKCFAFLGRITLIIYAIDNLLNSYVLPVLTRNMNLSYVSTLGETTVVIVICVAGNWLIGRFSFASKLFLGNRKDRPKTS